MAEAKMITFTYQEIAEALVKKQGIHEGIWGIYVEFSIGAANVSTSAGAEVVPAAIVPVKTIGIQRFPESNNLTIDAAKVNPAAPQSSGRKKSAKKTA